MKISENTKNQTYKIEEINISEFFYLLEKSYESCARWEERDQSAKDNPLFPLLKWFSDSSTIPHGPLDKIICEFITEVANS